MYPEKKISFLYEFLVILLVIIMAKCGAKLWPISLALLLALLVHGARKLLRWGKRHQESRRCAFVQDEQPTAEPTSAPVREQDVVAVAFGLLQRRITEQITAAYPGARWVWDRPGARERFAMGEMLTIQLNHAGGYLSADVLVTNLQFCALRYLPVTSEAEEEQPEETEESPETEEESIDYGLLAFEWVEANLQRLNSQIAKARADSHIGYRIPAEELPHGDSWQEICKVLAQNGLDNAEPVADGILITFKKETETA